LICTNCQHAGSFHSSKEAKDGSRRPEVNIRLVQGGLETGNGLTSLKKKKSSKLEISLRGFVTLSAVPPPTGGGMMIN